MTRAREEPKSEPRMLTPEELADLAWAQRPPLTELERAALGLLEIPAVRFVFEEYGARKKNVGRAWRMFFEAVENALDQGKISEGD